MDEKEAEARPLMGTIFLVRKMEVCRFYSVLVDGRDQNHSRQRAGKRQAGRNTSKLLEVSYIPEKEERRN